MGISDSVGVSESGFPPVQQRLRVRHVALQLRPAAAMRLSPMFPWTQTREIGFMLPNRSAGAGGFENSGISLSSSISFFLLLFEIV